MLLKTLRALLIIQRRRDHNGSRGTPRERDPREERRHLTGISNTFIPAGIRRCPQIQEALLDENRETALRRLHVHARRDHVPAARLVCQPNNERLQPLLQTLIIVPRGTINHVKQKLLILSPEYSEMEKWRMQLTKRVFLKSDGRMTIPVEIRNKLKLQDGSVLEAKVYGDDKLLITVLRQ